jgi:uncharacterized protein YndB with AHSA1/START domain
MTEATMTDTVVVEIDIDATPEDVFAALIEPDSVLDWWRDDGDGYACVALRSDATQGGRWWSEHRAAREDAPVCILSGEYVEFAAPHRLAFTWVFERYTAETEALPVTTVAIDVEPRGEGTHVRLTHSGFRSGSSHAEDHRSGWQKGLERLARLVSETA